MNWLIDWVRADADDPVSLPFLILCTPRMDGMDKLAGNISLHGFKKHISMFFSHDICKNQCNEVLGRFMLCLVRNKYTYNSGQ